MGKVVHEWHMRCKIRVLCARTSTSNDSAATFFVGIRVILVVQLAPDTGNQRVPRLRAVV